MTSTVRRRVVTLVATPLLALTALVGGALPAHAAPEVELVASADSIQPGESVTLSWTANADATSLLASGAWTGSRDVPSGTEVVTPAGPGTYTYTLMAFGDEGASAPSTVVVVVEERITPEAVTFDGCAVTVPEDEGVAYFVDLGGDLLEPVAAGTYALATFAAPGEDADFVALPSSDVRFDEDATTAWSTTVGADCADASSDLVETTVTCGNVRFTNVSDGPVLVLYGDRDEDGPDGDAELEPGESVDVATDRDELYFIAYGGPFRPQDGTVDATRGCGAGAGDGAGAGADHHPTVAPAAGVGDDARAE